MEPGKKPGKIPGKKPGKKPGKNLVFYQVMGIAGTEPGKMYSLPEGEGYSGYLGFK